MHTITTANVLAVLTPIWHQKPETARRVRQRIGAVMKWAVARGFRPDNPAGDMLSQALGRQADVTQQLKSLLPIHEAEQAVEELEAELTQFVQFIEEKAPFLLPGMPDDGTGGLH